MSFAKQSDPNLISTEAGNVMPYPEDGGYYRDIYRINIDVKDAVVIINGKNMTNVTLPSTDGVESEADSEQLSEENSQSGTGNTNASTVGVESSVKVKLTNFTEGLYECQFANRVLSIKDNYDMGSVSGVFSFVKNFKGFRHYLNYHATVDLQKTIEIDVTGDVSINCSVGEGEVTITGIRSSEDCTVNIENGNLTLKDSCVVLDEYTGFPKRGALMASVEKGNVEVEHGEFAKYTVKFGKAAYSTSDGAQNDSENSSVTAYDRKEHKELGDDYNIGEYNVTTAFGRLVLKESSPFDCDIDIEYSSDEKGVYSAAPNAAGTRYNVTEKYGSFITVILDGREGSAESESGYESEENDADQNAE